MTDREQLIGMLERAGIQRALPDQYVARNWSEHLRPDAFWTNKNFRTFRPGEVNMERAHTAIEVHDGGYCGLCGVFRFRADGSLIGIDFLE